MTVRISQRAEDDLACIYAWLASHQGIEAAERFRTRAEQALRLLRKHPEAGPHPAWATCHRNLRFWVISLTNYIIHYEYRPDTLAIERVLDGRRDVPRIIERKQEEPPPEE